MAPLEHALHTRAHPLEGAERRGDVIGRRRERVREHPPQRGDRLRGIAEARAGGEEVARELGERRSVSNMPAVVPPRTRSTAARARVEPRLRERLARGEHAHGVGARPALLLAGGATSLDATGRAPRRRCSTRLPSRWKSASGPIARSPARRRSIVAPAPRASGETTPMPVTQMRMG